MRRRHLWPAPTAPMIRTTLKLESLEDRRLPAVLTVGPGEQFAVPSQAAAVAQDGDDVQIDAGLYVGDVAVWRASNLTLEGVGGFAHLDAGGRSAQGKAIWVIQGDNTTVLSIEFSGAVVPDRNGAGIRQEGAGLTVCNCYFHDNQEGILTGANPNSDVVIEYSEFTHNGYGDGYSHNMYIGNVRSFWLIGSYTHDAVVGHEIKSRAQENFILYNRIQESDTGTASYDIDLPNGGANFIIGNVIRKGPRAQNPVVISAGEEGATNPVQEFYLVNNTIVNDRGAGTFVRVVGNVAAVELVNNLFAGQFAGRSTVLSGNAGQLITNLVAADPGFVDTSNFDYHLTGDSAAIDAGTDPGVTDDGVDLTPYYQYVDQVNLEDRPMDGTIDIGAFEYAGDAPGLSSRRDFGVIGPSSAGRVAIAGQGLIVEPGTEQLLLDLLTEASRGWPSRGPAADGGTAVRWADGKAPPMALVPDEWIGTLLGNDAPAVE